MANRPKSSIVKRLIVITLTSALYQTIERRIDTYTDGLADRIGRKNGFLRKCLAFTIASLCYTLAEAPLRKGINKVENKLLEK